jgi:hypothetical protein
MDQRYSLEACSCLIMKEAPYMLGARSFIMMSQDLATGPFPQPDELFHFNIVYLHLGHLSIISP